MHFVGGGTSSAAPFVLSEPCLRQSVHVAGVARKLDPFCTHPLHNNAKEHAMNWDQIQGNWKQVSGKVRETWGKITDDDFEQIAGKRDQLIGTIQKRYGIAKEEAEKQVRRFEDSIH
jgi:uncharacterized protein YjbJ (UPF0337 family)